MKRIRSILLVCVALTPPLLGAANQSILREFITVRGDQLMEGKKPFRFISANIPNLFYVEDNVAFTEENPWRLADQFEIQDAIKTIRQMGGQVVRPYVLAVARSNDTASIPRFVLGPGKFNEEAFRTLDQVLFEANQEGIRIILPFVDNWSWWGGIAEYAGFRDKPRSAFWSDPQVIADFKQTIRHVVTRTNTLTGIPYSLDKAILCWETGNELESPPAWTKEIAAFIKSLDKNHLVMDGFHSTEIRSESLAMSDVDIVTTHHYPGNARSYADFARENWNRARGKKPYVIGEFGFVQKGEVASLLEAVEKTGTSGALIWSVRPRSRDGGFYWHSEPAGGNKFKAYHWPGFTTGNDYEEREVLALLQERAYAIRGLAVPRIKKLSAPKLLPIQDAAAIYWQGTVGAVTYQVERAPSSKGPWTIAGDNIDETAVQYRPLFADIQAKSGSWYYRVRARSEAGLSSPSKVEGPVKVTCATLVDELVDLSLTHAKGGQLTLETRDCRKAKEDAHRVKGVSGSYLVYRLGGLVQSYRVYAFCPDKSGGLRISLSEDGIHFSPAEGNEQGFDSGAGDYGYWAPILFSSTPESRTARFLRIEFEAEGQIGRVEISYSLPN